MIIYDKTDAAHSLGLLVYGWQFTIAIMRVQGVI